MFVEYVPTPISNGKHSNGYLCDFDSECGSGCCSSPGFVTSVTEYFCEGLCQPESECKRSEILRWVDTFKAVEVKTDELSDQCGSFDYDVDLNAASTNRGSHFFISAIQKNKVGDDSSCPKARWPKGNPSSRRRVLVAESL